MIYAKKHRTENAVDMVKRFRRCIPCGVRFSTYERDVDGTEDLVITAQGKAQEGQDEAPGQAEQEQDATEDGRDPDGKDPDERDAENLAHLTRFVKALVRPARPSPARAEAQPATPPGGREHHLAVRDAG